MRKIIGALNMTIDGICDHTAGIPDEAIHMHYTELLQKGDAILYGRKTYELMTYWQTILENPSEEKTMNEFALAIDTIPKIVFSNTLKEINWKSASLSQNNLKEEVIALKKQSGKAILVGSRSLIIALLQLNLIDELQLCIHPMVEGKGLSLFENINERMVFNLVKHKTFTNGAIILYYQPKK
ncbi:dihydrofolate reductase family protein [Flavobacterium sp. NRK F7]|uniref:dihydrofolate reductase family protein n=1 Tax=Flavobacterium sp. NRK F7 TaxID=2954930 RepID=UPI0020915109|nr:dihydrofolate reductase family protein [Flavobacterium sp. NRK F7]MCO6164077.1 dihydrofolate reductase family protein [Flavobacterium sp. NRK F7]